MLVSRICEPGGGQTEHKAHRGQGMVLRITTVVFRDIEELPVDVQVMIAPGKMGIPCQPAAMAAVALDRGG